MTAPSLSTYIASHGDDPALVLFAQTTAALRDARFIEREDDTAAAIFLADETPQRMAPETFDKVLALIDQAETRDQQATQRVKGDPIRAEIAERLPSPVREAALQALDHERWRFAGIGIKRLALDLPSQGHAELMRIEPGRGVAPHAHGGDELTLVLTGAYFDGFEHYGPGDISLAQDDFTHAPKADPGEICYVLAISYGPPRLGGIYGLIERMSRRR